MSKIQDDARWLVGQIDQARAAVKALGKPQLANSSIEAGSIPEYDIEGTLVSVTGAQYDGTHGSVVVAGPVPPEPAAPSVTAGAGQVEVRWSGKFLDDAASPMDFSHVSVHASELEAFTPDNTTQRATITGESGDVATIMLDSGEWTIGLVAVSKAGKWSDLSEVVTVIVAEVVTADAMLDQYLALDQSIADVQLSVNGKNRIYNSILDAAGTEYVEGDRWQKWTTLEPGGALKLSWRFTGGAWVAESMDPTYLPKVDIGQGTFGSLSGGRLEVGSVLASSMAIGDFTNLIPNAQLQAVEADGTPTGWTVTGGTMQVVTSAAGLPGLKATKANGTAEVNVFAPWVSVIAGESIRLSYTTEGSWTGNAAIYGLKKNAAGVVSQFNPGTTGATTPGDKAYAFVVPADAVQIQFRPYISAGSGAGTYTIFSNMMARRMATGALLVDGAIDGKLITGPTIRTAAAGDRIELAGSLLTAFGKLGNTPVNVTLGPGSVGVAGGASRVVGLGFDNGSPYPSGLYSDGSARVTLTSAGIGGIGDSSLQLSSNGSGNSFLSSWPRMDITARAGLFLTSPGVGVSIQNVIAPTSPDMAANKEYVDNYMVPTILAASGSNLNNCTSIGCWNQSGNNGAAAGTNYPVPLAGLLEVQAAGSFVYQRYTEYNTGIMHTRTKYLTTWYPWSEVAQESAWVKLANASGWADYVGGGGYRGGIWARRFGDNVQIVGMVKSGSGTMAILPPNLCPTYSAMYPAVAAAAGCGILVAGTGGTPAGAVTYLYGPAAPSYVNITLTVPLS
jgi:hypothetical protein